jgi:hypothetical protein
LISFSTSISHKSDFALNIGIANDSKSVIQVISFNSSAKIVSSLVVVADLNNRESDKIQASIIVQISLEISNPASLYILYKIEPVEQIGSTLTFIGVAVSNFIL